MEVWSRTQVTAICVTHDVDEAILLADRVVMMTNGPNARIGRIMDVEHRAAAYAPRTARSPALLRLSPGAAVVPRRVRAWRRRPYAGAQRRSVRRRWRAISLPSRSAIWRASSPASLRRARRATGPLAKPAGAAAAEPVGPDAIHLKAQDRTVAAGGKLSDQEKFKREEHPFDAYARLTAQAATERAAEAGRQFPLALLRPVLCGAGADVLHVPAADPERHPEALAVRGPSRRRRAIRRRLLARHHARQPADPRDRAQERSRSDRGDPGTRTVLARLRRRQHSQRHRHADRRYRSARTDRYGALRARSGTITSSTIVRSTACRASSTSRSTAPARSRCWKIPTTSAFRPWR